MGALCLIDYLAIRAGDERHERLKWFSFVLKCVLVLSRKHLSTQANSVVAILTKCELKTLLDACS